MLKEFEERITDAKNKQFRMLERFHIGDAVYPFWLKGIIVYGIVTDVDTVARKIICDFNGVRRQFCPEDLMHVNPELVNASTVKKRNASKGIDNKDYSFYVVLGDGNIESGWEYREDALDRMNELKEDGVKSKVMSRRALGEKPLDDANWHKGRIAKERDASDDGAYSKFDETHISEDTDNGISATCKKCGGEIAVSYDEKTATSDFVCTKCGNRIPEDKLTKETKKAMRNEQARNMIAGKTLIDNEKELSDLLKRTIAEIDRGMHCWCQLPSGNWFCTEDEDGDDGKGILCCYINERTDSLGYPMGEMLVDCGIVHDESECDDVAAYAFECDKELAGSDEGEQTEDKEMVQACARIANELLKNADDDDGDDDDDEAEDDAYAALDDAFHRLVDEYGDKLDYDMGWKQDIMNGVIYINYYGGMEDDGFEVTFNISYEDGEFTVVAVDWDGTEVTSRDAFSSMDELVEKFDEYFPVVDRYLIKAHQDDEDEDGEFGQDYYDEGHAKEWMDKHPYGWYNSEDDYGTGDEDDDRFASKKSIAQELARVAKMLIRRD